MIQVDEKVIKRQLEMAQGALENLHMFLQLGLIDYSGDTVTISRDEYDSLSINQARNDENYVRVPKHSESRHSDETEIHISDEQRHVMVLETATKPARVFVQIDRFPWDEHDDSMGNCFARVGLELRNMDCLRVQIPPHYSKELVLQAMDEIKEWLNRGWERMSEDANAFAQRCNREDVKAARQCWADAQREELPF